MFIRLSAMTDASVRAVDATAATPVQAVSTF